MYKDLVKRKDGFEHIESQCTKPNNSNTLLKLVVLLLFLQITRILLKESLVYFLDDNLLNNYIASAMTIIVLFIFILYKSKKESIKLNIFSYMKTSESKSYYTIVTISILLLVLISNMSMYNKNIDMVCYSVYIIILIPIYEEIIFRSYVWSKLQEEYKDEFKTYLVTTTLFSLWQIGYIDIIGMNVGYNSLWMAVLTKCSIMLSYGFFIGYFRYKLKNTYSSILIHSFINIFRI